MLIRILLLLFAFNFLFLSCSKKEELVYETTKKKNPYEIYKEAYEAFNKRDYFFAAKKFSDAELNFERVEFAAKSALMNGFSLYAINFYDESLESLNRYLKQYPADENNEYAHYLIAVIYYEQITDEKRDLDPILKAKEKIEFFLEKFPNNDYSTDLKFKKELIINQLAAKEMYVGRYYVSVKKWIPAINRFKKVVEQYEKTIFVEEALHRLVEIYYHIGAESEAKSYAAILGYNYNSSDWFKQSYKVINKDYKIKKKSSPKDENLSFLKKIIKKIN
tara:strand:- start:3276 stop:4106 length:831 start_codon:yes stop_codon:yes gene_type:complete